jgi:hypothetical protein
LTENSKEKLIHKWQAKKEEMKRECDQLYFQLKKAEKTTKNQSIISQYHQEINKRKEKMKLMEFKLQQIDMLPLGSELKEREVNAVIEVKEGDNWDQLLNEKTIVIEDGVVKEIR